MARFKSRVVEVEAVQFDGSLESAQSVTDWIREKAGGESQGWAYHGGGEYRIDVRTPNGIVTACKGDYIVCGTEGEFYPCGPAVFEKKYEGVSRAEVL